MKTKRLASIFALLLLSIFITGGCAKTVRYSPEELKGFPPEIQERIKSGEVAIGMTTQQVRYAWGSPSSINILPPTEDGKMKEEWIYSKIGLFLEKRLLFIDNKLVDIFPASKPSGK